MGFFGDSFNNTFGSGSSATFGSKTFAPISTTNPISGGSISGGSKFGSFLKNTSGSFLSQSGGYQPNSGSFEADQIMGGFKNALGSLLSGDFVGSAMAIVNSVKGLLDKDTYRQNITTSRLRTAMEKFQKSSQKIADLNQLVFDLNQNWAYESGFPGSYQQKFLDALEPFESAMMTDGYTYEIARTTNSKMPEGYDYKVWSEPTALSQAYATVKDNIPGGSNGLGTMAILGGLGFTIYSFIKK